MHFLVLFLVCEYKLKMQTETLAFSIEGVNMVPDKLLCTEWGQRTLLTRQHKTDPVLWIDYKLLGRGKPPGWFRKFKKVEQLSSTVEVVENEI